VAGGGYGRPIWSAICSYAEHKLVRLDLAIMRKTPVVLLKQVLAVRGTQPDVLVRSLQKVAQ
jgi:hypothetical protein